MIDCAEYYEFIEAHAEERVEDLALRLNAFSPEARTFILRQIEGRQRLRAKVPSWCAVPRLHFPPASLPRAVQRRSYGTLQSHFGRTLGSKKLDHPRFWSISPVEWA